jgi:hypothetical protein
MNEKGVNSLKKKKYSIINILLISGYDISLVGGIGCLSL